MMTITIEYKKDCWFSDSVEGYLKRVPEIDQKLSDLLNQATSSNYATWSPKKILSEFRDDRKVNIKKTIIYSLLAIVMTVSVIALPILAISASLKVASILGGAAIIGTSISAITAILSGKIIYNTLPKLRTESCGRLLSDQALSLRDNSSAINRKLVEETDVTIYDSLRKQLEKLRDFYQL